MSTEHNSPQESDPSLAETKVLPRVEAGEGFRLLSEGDEVPDNAEIWIYGKGPWSPYKSTGYFPRTHVIQHHHPIRVPVEPSPQVLECYCKGNPLIFCLHCRPESKLLAPVGSIEQPEAAQAEPDHRTPEGSLNYLERLLSDSGFRVEIEIARVRRAIKSPAPQVPKGAPLDWVTLGDFRDAQGHPLRNNLDFQALVAQNKDANDVALMMTARLHEVADERDAAQAQVSTLQDALTKAREEFRAIVDSEDAHCSRCDGSGQVWADGKAHYQGHTGPLMACPSCGGAGKITSADVGQIAADALAALESPSLAQVLKGGA